MTDNEIIKALECCIKGKTYGDCVKMGCPASTRQGCYYCLSTDDDDENTIYIEILKDALDLINRQQQEIERLEIQVITYSKKNYIKGIKDVVKRLKEKCGNTKLVNRILDDLAEEMIGEQE